MKPKPVLPSLLLLCVLGLIIEACNAPTTYLPAPPTEATNPDVEAIFIERPLNGSIYPVSAPIDLTTILRTTSWGNISQITFLVDGTSVATAAGSNNGVLGTYGSTWTPSDTGEHYIQSRAVLNNGTVAVSRPVRICVMSFASPSFGSETGGYLGPCMFPTRIPNPATSGNITMNARVSPQLLSFFTDPACPNSSVTLMFVAQVSDPQDLVGYAEFEYNTNGYGFFREFLNWTTTRPVNQKEYRGSTTIGPAYVSMIPTGGLRWRVTAYGRDGQVLQSTEGTIPTQTLQCSQQPLQIAPTATSTPASARDCPPGTYYASNQCIQIQIPSPTPRSEDQSPSNPQQPPSNPQQPPSNPQPSCPAGEVYTCDPVCGCAPG